MSAPTHQTVPGPAGAVFSRATIHNGIVYCSGVIGRDNATNTMVEGTIKERTVQCLKNLEAVLKDAGSSMDKLLKVNIFVTDMKDVPAMNEAYNSFIKEPRPARVCVAIDGLAVGTDIEIDCTAYI